MAEQNTFGYQQQQQQRPQPQVAEPMTMLGQFIELFETFLGSLKTVFPKCEKTSAYYNDFIKIVKPHKTVQQMVIKKWHDVMHPFYDACLKKDETVFLDENTKIEILDNLNFRRKWLNLRNSEKSVSNMWSYVQELNRFAAIYSTVPENVRAQMEAVSGGLLNDLVNENLDMSKLDVEKIGMAVLNNSSEEDSLALVQSLGTLWQTLGSVDNVKQELGPNGPHLPDIQKLMQGFNAMAETKTNNSMSQAQSMETVFKQGWKPPSM